MQSLSLKERSHRVKSMALSLGFDLVGVAAAGDLSDEGEKYTHWLGRGFHAGMGWLARNVERRLDPRLALEGCKNVVVLGVNYHKASTSSSLIASCKKPGFGSIAQYARVENYHRTVGKATRKLARKITEESDEPNGVKWYVDTGPVLEKIWAVRAGMGFIGKNCCLVQPRRGSWFFLAVILTTLELAPDSPVNVSCGTCRRCLDACPTGALLEPGVLDSNRCLSYLTIEHKGEISEELASKFSGWLFGCDICQDVCPFNRRFQIPANPDGITGKAIHSEAIPLKDIIGMRSQEEFLAYAGQHSVLRRAGLDVLKRTARLLQRK